MALNFTKRRDGEFRATVRVAFHISVKDIISLVCQEILTFGMPKRWSKKYIMDSVNSSLSSCGDSFYTRIESCEESELDKIMDLVTEKVNKYL